MLIYQLQYSIIASFYYVFALYVSVYLFSCVLIKIPKIDRNITKQNGRYGCLDGLRGVLALGVFIHHSYVAYLFFTTGAWVWTESPLFNQLGKSTVALFFMITSYLFSSKLIMSERYIDFCKLYIGRVARLFPLYVLVVVVVVFSVFVLTNWQMKESIVTLMIEIFKWITFVVFGRPYINGFEDTWRIIAGVNWSLKYEWLFYFSLPFIYWPLKMLSRPIALRCLLLFVVILGLVGYFLDVVLIGSVVFLGHFACGILVALMNVDAKINSRAKSVYFQVLSLPVLFLLLQFKNADNIESIVLSGIIFFNVSNGFSFFGLLKMRAILWLGDISYGIYLLHGLVLYWVLFFLHQKGLLVNLNAVSYCVLVAFIGFIVLSLASLSYIYIEKPVISYSRFKKNN